ncbi:hypothetical protein GGR54DRAFT_272085 [Hypoxylon sp. NC1633]|nr:hypothetical protein GGR54DRAFT_272085 [Hypoxylon sp. NC1633]
MVSWVAVVLDTGETWDIIPRGMERANFYYNLIFYRYTCIPIFIYLRQYDIKLQTSSLCLDWWCACLLVSYVMCICLHLPRAGLSIRRGTSICDKTTCLKLTEGS